jgi:hypothetical protein
MSLNSQAPAAQNILLAQLSRPRRHRKGFNVEDCAIHEDKHSNSRAWGRVKPALILILLILLPAPVWAGRHRATAKSASGADPGYVLALGTADRFLHAWETGDLETGMVLLSDHVRRTQNAERIEEFFSAGEERGFEITRGAGHKGRYRFPIVLVTREGNTVRRVSSKIILVNTGKNDWAVDRLP